MWTVFFDMSSGGSNKEKFTTCIIEASEFEAISIFEDKFGRHP